MTLAASASPISREPGSRFRLLPDKATISNPFFRCCLDADPIDRRVAVFCDAAIYNFLSFLAPYCCPLLRLVFVCVNTKLLLIVLDRFPYEALSLIASSHLSLVNNIRFWTANHLLESRLGRN